MTFTDSRVRKVVPAKANCSLPLPNNRATGPGSAFAVNLTSSEPGTCAVTVFVPAEVFSIQAPTDATPSASVRSARVLIVPSVTNETSTPLIGFPFLSVARTAGTTGAGVPTVPVTLVCVSGSSRTIRAVAGAGTSCSGSVVPEHPAPANVAAKTAAMIFRALNT